ncbi:hypothetical protein [Acrocarpospora sp. B8E8]|uniref:hypothetical protein n=1 Tax=Acrocarpospora sp. B8E8 TaxID=3153572 RepID=UPI00325FB6F4
MPKVLFCVRITARVLMAMAPRALPATYVLDRKGRVAAFFGAVTAKRACRPEGHRRRTELSRGSPPPGGADELA